YNSFGDALTSTDPLGNTTTLVYDARGNLRSTAFPDGPVFQGFVDQQGALVSVGDSSGATQLENDGAGRVVREIDPLGQETLFDNDANGNVLQRTVFQTIDGVLQELTTNIEYDAMNHVTAVHDPLGGVSHTEYDALGLKTAEVDELGRRTTYEYDATGRLNRTTYPDGTFETYAYDAGGNKIQMIDRAGRVTLYQYDALNRLEMTILPDDTPLDPTDNPRVQTVYDAAGRIVAEIDANGQRTDYEYDAAGQRIRTLEPAVLD